MSAVEPIAVLEGEAAPNPAPDAAPGRRGRTGRKQIVFWLAIAWLAVIVVGAVTAPWLPLPDELRANVSQKLARPGSPGHLLGTDGLGRDILARLVHGARVSLVVSVAAVTIGVVVGGALGVVVGFVRGWFERVAMALTDVALAFPALVLLLALLAFVGQSLPVITVTIGLLSVPRYTRVARASTLSVAEREFVLAATALGAHRRRILLREIVPNVLLPLLAFALLSLGVVIVLEGSLSFLGLSVEQPTPTWGGMIADGKRHLQAAPHVAAVPSAVMFLTVLAVNFVGDQLRSRWFDVRESSL